jgi:GNAT superfamily N-acetyltransferase
LEYRPALPEDIAACVVLRGKTRENAVSAERLASLGITVDAWSGEVRSGVLAGHVATDAGVIVGYCFGHTGSGEIAVLALLPDYEAKGAGRRLLELVVGDLGRAGHQRLHLGCSSDPRSRSYGFYRHLGWTSTGKRDALGDEVLEYFP